MAEDGGEPISAAASRGSDGRLRLQVAVARTRRWRRAAVTGSRRGVRQCGKARHLGQRMANALPSPGPKSLWPILVVRESLTARQAIRREEPLVRIQSPRAAVVSPLPGAELNHSAAANFTRNNKAGFWAREDLDHRSHRSMIRHGDSRARVLSALAGGDQTDRQALRRRLLLSGETAEKRVRPLLERLFEPGIVL